jgi:hypothetical protein
VPLSNIDYTQAVPPPAPTRNVPRKAPVFSIIALVSGIIGIPLSFVWIGFVFGFGGLLFGLIGMRKEPLAKGFWLTGIITGIVSMVIAAIVVIVFVIVLIVGAASATYPNN